MLCQGAYNWPEGYPWIVIGYFTFNALLLYLPQAIATRFHGRDVRNIAIIILETTKLLGLWEEAGLVGKYPILSEAQGTQFSPKGGSLSWGRFLLPCSEI